MHRWCLCIGIPADTRHGLFWHHKNFSRQSCLLVTIETRCPITFYRSFLFTNVFNNVSFSLFICLKGMLGGADSLQSTATFNDGEKEVENCPRSMAKKHKRTFSSLRQRVPQTKGHTTSPTIAIYYTPSQEWAKCHNHGPSERMWKSL
jgi:hypothetical protein